MFYSSSSERLHLGDLYRGATAFLILNGPSLKQHRLEKLARTGILTVGMNNGPRLVRPKIWISTDLPVRFLPSVWLDPTIIKFASREKLLKNRDQIWDVEGDRLSDIRARNCPGVVWFETETVFDEGSFFETEKLQWGVVTAKSTMLCAIRILYELGIREIYMLGCDFSMETAEPYGFAEYVTADHVAINQRAYEQIPAMLAKLAPYFARRNLRIYNCNPMSKLTTFPIRDFDEVVEEAARRLERLLERERVIQLYDKRAKTLDRGAET